MTSPERRWWRAKHDLGDALQENSAVTERYEQTSQRAPEIIDLAQQGARTEAALELARVNLDLARLKDRRSRGAHDQASRMASLRGKSSNTLGSYEPDVQLAEAQSAFDDALRAHHAVEQALEDRGR